MKNGWQTKKLREVCELVNGRAYNKSELLTEGKYRVLRVGNFFTNDHWYHSDLELEEKKYCDTGDLLYAWSASFGPRIWSGGKVIYHYHIWKVVHDRSQIDQKFLFYFFEWDTEKIKEDQGTGTTMMHVSKGSMDDRDIYLAPLPEQQRIVGVLDEAFAGIATAQANAEKNLQNVRALFASHLQSVFTLRGKGWVEKPLGELCERLHQGLNTAGEKVKFYQSGYPIIQTRNIDEGVVELDSKMKFMSEEDWQIYKEKYRPEIGDVFFTNIGTIGKTAIVTTDRDYLIHWNIFKLRPLLGKITSEFLRYTLEQLTLSGYFEKLQKGGTVDFVTKKMISEALIVLPTIAEQKAIVAKFDSLRKETHRLAHLYERKLAALEALKKSLLHQAFTGQL